MDREKEGRKEGGREGGVLGGSSSCIISRCPHVQYVPDVGLSLWDRQSSVVLKP